MFSSVLLNCSTNIDRQLLQNVSMFCRKASSNLTALNVLEPPTKAVLGYFKTYGKNLEELLLGEQRDMLISALKDAGLSADDVNSETRWGTEFIEVVKSVQENGHDLVITNPKEDGEYPDSTAMHLLRKCPCPVWVHRGRLWGGAVRVLAAVGANDPSDANIKLDETIMRIAVELNRILGGRLHILHCWQGSYEATVKSSRFFSESEADKYTRNVQMQSETYFSTITESVSLPDKAKKILLHGNPSTIIPEYAREQYMDIVVMGSVARTGIPGLFIGNTAEKIIRSLSCSILTVKPEGFVSPIK